MGGCGHRRYIVHVGGWSRMDECCLEWVFHIVARSRRLDPFLHNSFGRFSQRLDWFC